MSHCNSETDGQQQAELGIVIKSQPHYEHQPTIPYKLSNYNIANTPNSTDHVSVSHQRSHCCGDPAVVLTVSSSNINDEETPLLYAGPTPLPLYNTPQLTRDQSHHPSELFSMRSVNHQLEKWRRKLHTIPAHLFGTRHVTLQEVEIEYSVFKCPSGIEAVPVSFPPNGDARGPVSKETYQHIVENSIVAMEVNGISPRMIKAGSSGSYFIFNTNHEIVGVFKPQDEEPYGPLSPKLTKWIHRNFFPCFFGRSCLIPNTGYIAESAASIMDSQLQTYIVPYTDTVELSSNSFYYPFYEKLSNRLQSRKTPRTKVGSYQLFVKGYMGADEFFKKYPLPEGSQKGWIFNGVHSRTSSIHNERNESSQFNWNAKTLANLRDEIEKMVILDFIIRNTDRGLDNWMLKLEYQNTDCGMGSSMEHSDPVIKLAAIDNGLSFPWKHPNEWRSFPYGWLYLPISIIGQPFSTRTRTHFLSLLGSTKWWEETTVLLKEVFSRDSGFKERMFKKQLAVLKGQAFNVVETLKIPQEGPLDLVRKRRVLICDQEVEIPVVSPFSTLIDSAAQTPVIVEKTIRSHTSDPQSKTNETKNHGENLEHVPIVVIPPSDIDKTGALTGCSNPVNNSKLRSFAGNDISFSGNNIKNEAENGVVTNLIHPQTDFDNYDYLNSNDFTTDIAGNINQASNFSNGRINNAAYSATESTCYRSQDHNQDPAQNDNQWVRSRSVQLQKTWNQLVSGEIDEPKFNEMMSNFNNQGPYESKLEESGYPSDVSFKYDKSHHNHKDFSDTSSQDQGNGAHLHGNNANGQTTGERFIGSEIGTSPKMGSDAVSIGPLSYTNDGKFKMKNYARHFDKSTVDINQNSLNGKGR
ncbi:unnamed protein product [Ambrosiozyma monospora]|uniref:Unnamed protein product n=1 Tax=Ambrosiozyma monospora TaxID=43982 RepID=A0ACB5SZK6_AMBMO|nr:unnamed protein product [Ambrosiozyma monospora]